MTAQVRCSTRVILMVSGSVTGDRFNYTLMTCPNCREQVYRLGVASSPGLMAALMAAAEPHWRAAYQLGAEVYLSRRRHFYSAWILNRGTMREIVRLRGHRDVEPYTDSWMVPSVRVAPRGKLRVDTGARAGQTFQGFRPAMLTDESEARVLQNAPDVIDELNVGAVRCVKSREVRRQVGVKVKRAG